MKKTMYLLLPVLFAGCVVTQKIGYKTDNLPYQNDGSSIPISVNVLFLTDNRLQNSENDILFTTSNSTVINKKTVCINAEKFYKKDSVSAQLTQMMVNHFNHARLFNYCACNDDYACDYYLTGTLNMFYGEQEFSTAAVIGAQFGLIGALATAALKTKGKIIFDISDIKLYKKDGTLIKDMGNFYKEYNEDLPADASCWCIYNNINQKLIEYNTYLTEKIRSDLAELQF
ncbi:MAG: hypothetical protein PHG64_07950 [Paludibacter sp.]|nr:hypothetical protein [Paludibacter sp.]